MGASILIFSLSAEPPAAPACKLIVSPVMPVISKPLCVDCPFLMVSMPWKRRLLVSNAKSMPTFRAPSRSTPSSSLLSLMSGDTVQSPTLTSRLESDASGSVPPAACGAARCSAAGSAVNFVPR